jgi:hypothetical protein
MRIDELSLQRKLSDKNGVSCSFHPELFEKISLRIDHLLSKFKLIYFFAGFCRFRGKNCRKRS